MILAYIEIVDGEVKKTSFEVAQLSANLAQKLSVSVMAVAVGKADTSKLEEIGNYGISKVLHLNVDANISQNIAQSVSEIANQQNASVIVFPKSVLADSVAAKVAIQTKAGIVNNVAETPEVSAGFVVKRSIYTGKAFAKVEMKASKKVIILRKNAITLSPSSNKATVENFGGAVSQSSIKIKETSKASGDVLLTDAEIVVSGGRGLKGPENWHLIENFAKSLGAATGCSKPVSDMDWRPHHEHVGQTGVKVAPNIYFAVGISGAIQHLAGVNSSKVLVAINIDPEAPFFKAADYGIVGDAFDILPKLTEAAKKL
jgi:electron transfer flavoprotein alpha subunit